MSCGIKPRASLYLVHTQMLCIVETLCTNNNNNNNNNNGIPVSPNDN
jgi:hypothetical protein